MRRVWALAPLGVLALLAVLFLGFGLHHDPHVEPAALVGRPTPALALSPLQGGAAVALRTEATRAGPSLVNVFASWCVPCAQEAPALMAMKAQGARLVGVSYKDDATATRAFLATRGDPFATVLMDPDGRAGVELGISGVPETFVVAADGRIIAKHAGPLGPKDAEELLDKAETTPARGPGTDSSTSR